MKKLILVSTIAVSSLVYNTANAQIRFRLGLHFGPARVIVQTPPIVAYTEPVNYNGNEDYYYLPDLDAYYSVPEQCYYYMNEGQWVSAAYLPGAHHDFDWRYARHYEIRAPRPFMHYDYYRSRYNGVAFNGRWDHFDNSNYYGNDNHNNRPDNNRGNDQHFAQNNIHGNDHFVADNHRPGRF